MGRSTKIPDPRLSVDKSDYTAGMKLAKVLAAQGAFQQSIALMRSLDVLPNEGAQEGRNLWRETNLDYACALIGAKQFRKALDAIAQGAPLAREHGRR